MKKDLKILLIEDEETVIGLLKRVLNSRGFSEPDVADSKLKGMELISRKKYDLIISNTYGEVNIPYSPAIVKKAVELNQNPKIIAMSGYPDAENEWREIKLDAFLTKPLHMAEFLKILNNFYP